MVYLMGSHIVIAKMGLMGFVESFREVFVIWVSWFVVWEYVEHVSCQTCC